MPINKYRLEDFQSWIEKQSKERQDTTAQDIFLNKEVDKPAAFVSLNYALLTPCSGCWRKYKTSHPNEYCVGSVPPSTDCLNDDCSRIKNVWEKCVQSRDFRILNAPQPWPFNALGETVHDVILKWMNEVDQKKTQRLEQEEKFIQNQLVLAPKK